MLIAPALAGLLVFGGACGGGSGGPSGPEADERYLTELCTGFGQFTEGFLEAVSDLSNESSDREIQDALEKPIDDLVKAMERAEPPRDVRDYHEDSLDQIKDLQEQVRAGNLEALTRQDEGVVPEPPEEVQARLSAVAANISECQGLGLFE